MAMRFEVPQFIDIKDKIFGPFTFVQFVFIAGGLGIGYIIIRLVPTFFRYVIAIIPVAFGLLLAFFKFNGRPFTYTVQSFFIFLFSSKLYLWRQRPPTKQPEPKQEEKSTTVSSSDTPSDSDSDDELSDQRLRDLAWNLDILEKEQ